MKSDCLIWILEDDPGCQFVFKECLEIRYRLEFMTTLAEFKQRLAASSLETAPDLVITDLRLPDGTFLSFLSSLDEKTAFSPPFMVVSSVHDLDALRFCFEEGALDYLTKPFRAEELIVKVERMLARITEQRAPVLEKFTEVSSGLTLKQRQILELLMERAGQVITRQEILARVWSNVSVHPKALDVHMYNLRKRLFPHGVTIVSDLGGWKLSGEWMKGDLGGVSPKP